ncbi:HIT family protein [Wenzhouxiangella sp. XN24]|uniref:HIT domain-containing protein n=1 Tax=Wenzhouxiangella sp. XN24 TaxID=2713569 RepID=UPI0013EAB8CE|nr:HIT family protein [Wenzhouxiangella sp. XN24]NGX16493.1 HIT domain-containing protein [Wenzhouxiangella sp. XN24]
MTSSPGFSLDSRLERDSSPLVDLELCSVRLMQDARYPWLVLVPRRPDAVEILDLAEPDQLLLWDEIRLCAAALDRTVRPHKLNIAALGNVVAQLHVHVIARFETDDAWPRPVWGIHAARPYDAADREVFSSSLLRNLGIGRASAF